MFVNNINPVIAQLGPFQIRWYGVIFVLGFIITIWYLDWIRKHGKTELTKDQVYDLMLYVLIGVVAGARLFMLIWDPSHYLRNPVELLKIWKGGLSFHGGLAGALIAGWYFSRKHKKSFLHIADIVSVPAVFGLALGRIANFINGELWGTITNVPWCVKFQGAEGCRHPVQIYGAIGRLLTGVILVVLNRKKHRDGFIFFVFITLIGIGRFFADFLRDDIRYLGLSTGQYLSIIIAAVGLCFLMVRHRQDLLETF